MGARKQARMDTEIEGGTSMVREERGIENDVILWEMRGMRRRGRPITTSVAYPGFF